MSPDKIYDLIDRWSPEGPPNAPPPFDIPSDDVRAARTEGSMAEESRRYGALVAGMEGLTGAAAAFDAPVQFGKFALAPTQVFYVSASGGTYATVNLKPLCPGHVLVIPKRVVPLLAELSEAELHELWQMVCTKSPSSTHETKPSSHAPHIFMPMQLGFGMARFSPSLIRCARCRRLFSPHIHLIAQWLACKTAGMQGSRWHTCMCTFCPGSA